MNGEIYVEMDSEQQYPVYLLQTQSPSLLGGGDLEAIRTIQASMT
jgi:hypothetical protein